VGVSPGRPESRAADPAWEALLDEAGPDVELGGFLRMTAGRYETTGGVNPNAVDSGLSISNARLNVDGRMEDVRVFVSLEASTEQGRGYLFKSGQAEELQVLDAFGQLALSPWASLQVGQFRPPVLFGALLDENDLLFVDRTFNDLFWQERDPGAQLHLDGDRLEGWLALQNGQDGAGEDLALTARATLRVFGEGEAPRREGAYDPDLGHTLYLGAAWYDDASLPQGRAVAAEAFYTWEWLSLSGEYVDHGDGILGGHSFWSATGAMALDPDTWELALRYEDFSSRSDTYVWRLGLNRYLRGPGTKLQANLVRFEHDGADNYQTLVEIGVVASF
jgi:hypothetical protein